MIKEQREEEILLSLKKLDYLTREQLQKLHNLGKKRNAIRVLNNMDEFLSTFSHDRKFVYYLNGEGRSRVNATKVRKKTAKVKHYLMRNDLFIHLGRPMTWQNEMRVKTGELNFIADAVFKRDKLHHFVEIDNKQSMIKNQSKIKKYLKLKDATDLCLIWVTTTPYRKKRLIELSKGLNVQIYLEDDLK